MRSFHRGSLITVKATVVSSPDPNPSFLSCFCPVPNLSHPSPPPPPKLITIGVALSPGSVPFPGEFPVCAVTHDPLRLLTGSVAGGRAEEGMAGRLDGRGSKENTKFHLFWVGWLIFFSLERGALNPIYASCQLCPRVPCGDATLANNTVGWVRSRRARGRTIARS